MARNRLVLAALLLALPAAAQKPRVAVISFNGPQGARAQGEAARALKGRAEVVSQATWDEAAKRLVATSHSAADIAAVANDLKVGVVITGAIKRDGGWVLVVTARHGPTGKSAEKLKYPLRGPRLDPPTLKRMTDDLWGAVEKASAGAPTGDVDQKETDTKPPDESENPLAKKEPAQPAPPPGEVIERPEWTPYVDASIGLLLSGRKLSFTESGQPGFQSSPLIGGLHLDATFYPLALLATRPGALVNALTGLGVGATFDYVFYADAAPPAAQQTMATCGAPPPCQFPTQEYRLEAGLRWHWNPMQALDKPELLVSAQFGYHNFSIGKRGDGTSVVPSITYSYLALGVGGRWLFVKMFGAFFTFNLLVPLSTGEIQSPSEFGSGGAIGFRPALGFEVKPWKGLTARLGGFIEYYSLSFSNSGMSARTTSGGATDLYWGLTLSLGFVF